MHSSDASSQKGLWQVTGRASGLGSQGGTETECKARLKLGQAHTFVVQVQRCKRPRHVDHRCLGEPLDRVTRAADTNVKKTRENNVEKGGSAGDVDNKADAARIRTSPEQRGTHAGHMRCHMRCHCMHARVRMPRCGWYTKHYTQVATATATAAATAPCQVSQAALLAQTRIR